MLRSRTVNTIHDLAAQGKSIQEIAQSLSISRNTVRKYLRHPEAVLPKPRPPRVSKLDPFKEQIRLWVMEDHCTNCEELLVRLQKLGYSGGSASSRSLCIRCGLRWLATRPSSVMKPSQESRSNLTGESLSTRTMDTPISSTALPRSWAIRACALSPLSNAAIPRRSFAV